MVGQPAAMPAPGFLQLVFVECRCVWCCVCGGGGGGVFGSVIFGLGFQDRLGPSPGNTEQQPRLTYSKSMLVKSMHLSYIQWSTSLVDTDLVETPI